MSVFSSSLNLDSDPYSEPQHVSDPLETLIQERSEQCISQVIRELLSQNHDYQLIPEGSSLLPSRVVRIINKSFSYIMNLQIPTIFDFSSETHANMPENSNQVRSVQIELEHNSSNLGGVILSDDEKNWLRSIHLQWLEKVMPSQATSKPSLPTQTKR